MHRVPAFHASPYLLLSLTSLFWSLNWVIARAIVGHVSPFALAFMRWVVALAIMMPFALPQIRAHWPQVKRHWKVIAWLGFFGTALHNAFAYVGLQFTTATNGVILNSATPVMIIVIGWLVYRDVITRGQSAGVAISLVGVLAILTRGDPSVLARLSLNKGDLIVLSGMLFWSAYTIFLRMKPPELPGLVLLACCGSFGLLLLLPLFVLEMTLLGGRIEVTPATAGAMLYLGVFPSVVSYVFWNRGVHEVGSNVAGIFMHLMPVFGSLLAWLFLGERICAYHLVGIALIIAGIALTSRGGRAIPEQGPE
ncbi:MAG: DMT family transporter [Bacillota bacterium]